MTEKSAIEQAIMEGTKKKYTAASHTPFMTHPLLYDFGYLGVGESAEEVLLGQYTPPKGVDPITIQFIQHLQQLQAKREAGMYPTSLPLQEYRGYWKKAREYTSCYPGDLSFASLKAAAQDDVNAEFECLMVEIPLFSGYAPNRWKKFLDVMLLKKEGLTQVEALRTIVLFQPDCNCAFNFLGQAMMKHAKTPHLLAPEQYGSWKNYRSIDLAMNKTITYDLLRQTKTPGAVCLNDAQSCYHLLFTPQHL